LHDAFKVLEPDEMEKGLNALRTTIGGFPSDLAAKCASLLGQA